MKPCPGLAGLIFTDADPRSWNFRGLGRLSAGSSRDASSKSTFQPEPTTESVYIRYVLAGGSFGGLVETRPVRFRVCHQHDGRQTGSDGDQSAALRSGLRVANPWELSLSGSNTPQYAFICKPVPAVSITGKVTHLDRLHGRDVAVQASYIARWASRGFLGIDDSFVSHYSRWRCIPAIGRRGFSNIDAGLFGAGRRRGSLGRISDLGERQSQWQSDRVFDLHRAISQLPRGWAA